jgi:hypothetical protein
MLCGGKTTENCKPDGENRDVVVIGMVPCKLSSKMHVDGRRVTTVVSGREAVTVDEPSSSARKCTTVNGSRAERLLGQGIRRSEEFFGRQ